jgi:hypothetical protein
MNHQPFRDWLLTGDEPGEDALTPQQRTELQDHLKTCESCRSISDAWMAVENHLHGQSIIGPNPGFTSRWETRLETERKRIHRRQTRLALLFSVGGATAILAVLVALIWPWLRSPSMLLWTWVYHLFTLYSYAELGQDLLVNLLRTATIAIPITWLIVLVGLLSELSVLWIVSYRLLTNPRRIVK